MASPRPGIKRWRGQTPSPNDKFHLIYNCLPLETIYLRGALNRTTNRIFILSASETLDLIVEDNRWKGNLAKGKI